MTFISPIINVKDESNLRTIINNVVRQVSDTTGDISVAANGTFILADTKIYSDSVINLMPKNASASNARYYVSERTDGQASIVFSSVASGPALFSYNIAGVR